MFILSLIYFFILLLLYTLLASSNYQGQGHHSSMPGSPWLFEAALTQFASVLARSMQRCCFGRPGSVSQGFARRYHASLHGKLAFYLAWLLWCDLLHVCKTPSFRSHTAMGPSTKPDRSYRRMAQSPRRWRQPLCQERLSHQFILDLWVRQDLYTRHLRLAQRSRGTPLLFDNLHGHSRTACILLVVAW